RRFVDEYVTELLETMNAVKIAGTEFPPIFTLLLGTTLSIFCKISSETSFSELISGTTSSCSATFLNSMLDWTEATLLTTAPLFTLLKVLTGTGISWPFAMIAFLLLLVNTIGREITRNRPVDSIAWTMALR